MARSHEQPLSAVGRGAIRGRQDNKKGGLREREFDEGARAYPRYRDRHFDLILVTLDDLREIRWSSRSLVLEHSSSLGRFGW